MVTDWRKHQKVPEITLKRSSSMRESGQENNSKLENDELVDIDVVASEMSSTEEKPIIAEI